MEKIRFELGSFNFLNLERAFSSFKSSKFVIIPVSYDRTTTFASGTREGAFEMIRASKELEWYDDELEAESYKEGIHTLDILSPSAKSSEAMIENVSDVVYKVLENDKFPIILGGEHTVSLGALRAFKKRDVQLSVVQFDAHADLRDKYQDSKYSNACVARRILEDHPLTQLGVRSLSKKEAAYIKESDVKTFFGEDVKGGKFEREKFLQSLSENVYLTIDLDVFDPSTMPAVGTPVPNGFDWQDVLWLCRAIFEQRNVIGFDVVELCPIPGLTYPNFTAAKLVYRLIGYKTFL